MGLRRRDFLTFFGGGAAGLAFTPVPWKLLDDTSIWTQNWPWIPTPARGETRVRFSTCTLCPAACGLRARCINQQPISIAGVASHPLSAGTICALAVGAHQLPYHPSRILQPLRNGSPVTLASALAELHQHALQGKVAIVDEHPARSASKIYRELATGWNGIYAVPANLEASTLERMAKSAGVPVHEAGIALENVRAVVSFGAPILESWGSTSRLMARWRDRHVEIIQVEPEMSHTAALATKWLSIRRGSEAVLARALAREISTSEAALATGLNAAVIDAVAAALRDRTPAICVSGGELADRDEQAIAAVNTAIRSTSFVRKRVPQQTPPTAFHAIEDGSVDLLLVDHGPLGGAVSATALRRKLRKGGLLVSFTPYRAGASSSADFVIPTPAFLESLEDAETPWDATMPSYSVAPGLLTAPPGVMPAADVMARIAGVPADSIRESAVRARVAELYAEARGEVFSYASAEERVISAFESADKLWDCFAAGACWTDPYAKAEPMELGAVAVSTPSAAPSAFAEASAVLPSLFAKVTQESPLRRTRRA